MKLKDNFLGFGKIPISSFLVYSLEIRAFIPNCQVRIGKASLVLSRTNASDLRSRQRESIIVVVNHVFYENHSPACLSSVVRSRTVRYSQRSAHQPKLTTNSPVHLASPQHQRRWKTEDYVRLDQNQGCRSQIFQLGLQKG